MDDKISKEMKRKMAIVTKMIRDGVEPKVDQNGFPCFHIEDSIMSMHPDTVEAVRKGEVEL